MLNDEVDLSWVTTIGELRIPQEQLAALAESWEPEASATPPKRRLSRCAACGGRMWFPWHIWLNSGGFKKELHVCNRCVRRRGWKQ
jgi:hypothetical protein